MGKFKFTKTSIEGVYFIEPTVFGDERGYLWKHTIKKNSKKQDLILILYKIINPNLLKELLEDFIFNIKCLRVNW